ncbi:peptidoglycan DD-metalloendopeptidase family protein [Candidatus Woesearchaeota archaeon]|nr:peptidoglycan DD-metalloendopeptidase family protein [Candidatus Woesearchaeota archaeon]
MRLTPIIICLLLMSIVHAARVDVVFNPADVKNFDVCIKSDPCILHIRDYYSNDKGPLNVGKNPAMDDKYFKDPTNVIASPEAAKVYFSGKDAVKHVQRNAQGADAYFGDPTNLQDLGDTQLDGAKEYFRKPGNLGKNPESSKMFLKKVGGEDVTYDIPQGTTATYDPTTNSLLNKGSRLALTEFKGATNSIAPLANGGYKIDGNVMTGFKNIKRIGMSDFELDDVRTSLGYQGNELTPTKMTLTQGSRVQSVAEKFGKPIWSVTNKGDTLAVFRDGTNVEGLTTAAVLVSEGKLLTNRFAHAELTHGPLTALAKDGTILMRSKTDLANWIKDPLYNQGPGYHIGVQSTSAKADGTYAVNRMDLNPAKSNGKSVNALDREGREEVQRTLNRLGFTDNRDKQLRIDGDIGKRSRQAITKFQKEHASEYSLSVTGELDQQTLDALIEKGADGIQGTSEGSYRGTIATRPSPVQSQLRSILASSKVGLPIKGRITDVFGVTGRRYREGSHYGLDIAVPSGTNVMSPASGTIAYKGWQRGWGNFIDVWDGKHLHRLAHLSSFVAKVGAPVTTGQVIAKSGQTGRATGPHVHWEIYAERPPSKGRVMGRGNIDPEQWLADNA